MPNLTIPPQTLQDELNEAAEAFANEYAGVTDEKGEGQNFMRDLCKVYKLNSRHAVRFEHRVKGADRRSTNFVDGFFPGLLLVEMKTAGKDLDAAYAQARDYVAQLKKPGETPRHILVSDFQNLHLYDEHADPSQRRAPVKFKLAEFRQHVGVLDFLMGYERLIVERQEKATIEAARRVGDLHDAVKATGYQGHDLQSLLVRLLFCMFADDTGLFDASGGDGTPFADLMRGSLADGSDLSSRLDHLFTSLNTEKKVKQKSQSETAEKHFYNQVDAFPYINGQLFEGRLSACRFTPDCRTALLHCCALDWSEISPDIFGTLFQHIMHWDNEASGGKSKKRREFGAHYTSERNILRAIEPLFLDGLASELDECRGDLKRLNAFHAKLGELKFLDPACGCGNFLVVAYRELRLLEQQVLQALERVNGGQVVNPLCDVHQFYGIEIDATAVEIATVAMWLTDHQMNMRLKVKPRIPLKKKAQIVCGNALQLDWESVLAAKKCSYIVGNPPFLGKKEQSVEQKTDMKAVFKAYKNHGVLDYVGAWYVKAAAQMKGNPAIKAAFVSTNSITQGEQVAVLWQPLIQAGVHIHFAHRTFKWSNEGSGVAAVHCVIIGFGLNKPTKCTLWDYRHDIAGEAKPVRTRRLNSYLVDAPLVHVERRNAPLCAAPLMVKGNEATDDGYLIFSEEEKQALTQQAPNAARWLRPLLGGVDFLNAGTRYCLWLSGVDVEEFVKIKPVQERLKRVRMFRENSPKTATIEKANTPWLFGEIRQPKSGNFIVIPKVSSERRLYMPLGFQSHKVVVNNTLQIIPNGTLFHFGVLHASMHMAWMRAVCGRMKSDYQYSINIAYNNYPWPTDLVAPLKQAIINAAQAVLQARERHPVHSLAWLYNPETMPANVRSAHDVLDAAVDEAYGYEGGNDDATRAAFLFARYQELTEAAPVSAKARSKSKIPTRSALTRSA